MTPVWLLDVDGVINAPRPGWGTAPSNGTAYSAANAYRMRWAPALIERIRKLHRVGGVEIRWASTWCGQTRQLETLFGLPHFDDAFKVPEGKFVGGLKLQAAFDVLGWPSRPLIWTDDTETPDARHPKDRGLYDELMSAGDALLIRPDSRSGLTPEDMGRIEDFCLTWADSM